MAFSSSVPAYNLDHHQQHHHTNWHHQLQQQQQPNYNHQQQLQNPQLPPPLPPQVDQGSIRPGSMVDRARIAKLPLPEAGLNCPRCDSTQTKFCYFNNYSLTQPRHFCKTCRRYWTRGGALRSVPVGGGCRRNKRSKSRTSKSPNINNNNNQKGPNNNNNISTESPSRSADQMVTNHNNNPFSSQVPLMAALQNLNGHYGATAGSTYGGFHMANGSSGQPDMGFHLGHNATSSVNNNILSGEGAQGWRLPILTGFEQPAGSSLFSYQEEEIEAASAGPVKVEEARGGLNLSRQFLGVSDQNNSNNNNSSQYWGTGGGNSWTTDFTSHINNSTSSASPFL